MTDDDLIKKAQEGDAQAFEALVEQYYEVMYRFAYQWCGNPNDAEDVVQQACIKLARSVGQFRFEAAFQTWLYRLVINCAKDWQSVQSRHQSEVSSSEQPSDNLINSVKSAADDNSGESHVLLHQVLALLGGLAEGFKEAVLLVHGEGLSHKEAANILQVKESTVSWRLHEVRKFLKQMNLLEAPNER